MGLEYVNGDLIKMAKNNQVQAFAHGCNCWCRMGAGFALQVKQNFPAAFYEDIKTHPGDIDKLGGYTFTDIYGFMIYNLYSQYNYGRFNNNFDPLAFNSGIGVIIEDCIKRKIDCLHIPLIGTGLAGGNWTEIEQLILTKLNSFPNFKIVVVNYV